MKNLSIRLKNEPGALADLGETLGKSGVSLEGGAVFTINDEAVANFLVEDGMKGKKALEEKGIEVISINDVLVQKLKQEVPGQLGKICRVMQQNNINILVQYSDHYNQLILVVDDHKKGLKVSHDWSIGKYD